MEEEKQEQKQENEKQEQEQTAPKKEKQEDENEFTNYYEEERRLLRKALREKKLVVFVGSGASKKSGIPLWDEAVKEYAKGIRFFSENKYEGNLKIPQMYFNARGRKEYVELSRQVFCFDKNLQPNEIHEILISLSIHQFITTNYDDLLEKEAQNQGIVYEVIAKDEDIPYKRRQREIIKMHGDFLSDNFVLKEDDYLNYSENFKLIETYIKAVIASNVVLFVGYSFNDPDTKQIFNWIKSILKEDFQRAYMLEVSEQYDPNNEEYYKNLGVNVIYAANLLKKFKKKDENKNDEQKKDDKEADKDNLNRKPYECTVKMLDYLFQKQEIKDVIDTLYDELMPFSKFNIVWYEYVKDILKKFNASMQEDTIIIYTNKESIINAFLDIVKGENSKTSCIRNVLCSAGIIYIEIRVIKELIYLEKKEFNYDWNKFYCFNYVEILDDIQKLELQINENNIQSHMGLAHMYYFIGNSIKAYGQLKEISSKAYKQQEYFWYFICEINRKCIGNTLWKDYISPLQTELGRIISQEAEKIDLDFCYNKLPTIFYKNNDPLKELYTKIVIHIIFEEIIKLKEKVEKQTKEYALTPFSNIEEMRYKMKKYYEYLINNYIIVDKYEENIELFKQYIKAVFQAYTADKKVLKEHNITNRTIDVINPFELFIIINYFSQWDISYLLSEFEIEKINLDKQGKDYIKITCKNFWEHIQQNSIVNLYFFRERFLTLFTLLSKIPLETDTVEKVMKILNNEMILSWAKNDREIIINFLCTQYENKSLTVESKQLIELLKNLLYIWIVQYRSEMHDLKEIFFACANIFQKAKKVIFYELDSILYSDEKYIEILVSIYEFCSDSLKGKIKTIVIKSLKERDVNNLYKYISLYFDALINFKMLNPEEIIEEKILTELKNPKEANPKEFLLYTTHEIIENIIVILFLNNKLIKKDDFINYLKESNKEFIEFSIKMDTFDYEQFDLEWFQRMDEDFINKISKNETAKEHIRFLFREKGKQGALSKELQEIYFKHFC